MQNKVRRTVSINDGYTLLFAVLTAALVLGVAVFILEISTKQYELSASARDSMYAFYAADSGIECVALNDGGPNGLTNVYDWTNSSNSITCGNSVGVAVTYTNFSSPGYQYKSGSYDLYATTTTFSLQFAPSVQPNQSNCAVITIIEYHDASNSYHDIAQSRGYNYCVLGNNSWGNNTWGPNISNATTLERAIQLSHSSD